MQLDQTCFNLFLTHIKQVNLLQDVHTLLKESLNTFNIDKIKSEMLQNDTLACSYHKSPWNCFLHHITGETLIGWTQPAERTT